MRLFVLRTLGIIMTGVMCPVMAGSDTAFAMDPSPQLPKFVQIEQAVRAYFQSLPDFQAGDVITRGQVESLIRQEKLLSWLGIERRAILDHLLQDDDYLVAELRSPAGRKFLPQIAQYPNGLDRLDRLSRLNNGKKALQNVLRVRDGYRLIETLATTPNGEALGKSLAKSSSGTDFNKPTGRIYTLDMLVAQLKQCYEAHEVKTSRQAP